MLKFLKKGGKKLSVIYAVITFVALLAVTQTLVYQRHRSIAQKEQNELVIELDDTKDKLNIALNQNLTSAKTMVMMYRYDPSLAWFDDVAKEVVETNDAIDFAEVVDKNFFITHIYPLKGNEHMIGFNVMSDPIRRAETQLALKDKTIKFSGPYELRQAGKGLGIAGRLPVYDGDSFIGGVVVITRLASIRKRMPELENKGGVFVYQLSKVNAVTKEREYFFDGYKPQKDWQVTRFMRRGNWTLHVAYAEGYISHITIYLLSVFGVLLSGMVALFVYGKTHERVKLEHAVKLKTRDLGARMKELSAIYQVNEILKDERQSMDIALSRVVKVIPSGFQHSETCAAHIVVGDNEYKSGQDVEKMYHMQAPMSFSDDCKGYVEVSLSEEVPLEDEGPFLKDERALLNALAETIEVYYDKKLSRDKIARSEASLRSLVEAMPIGVLLADVNGTILSINSKMRLVYSAMSVRSLIVGDNFIEAVRDDRKEEVMATFHRVVEDMEPVDYEVKYGTEEKPLYLAINMIPVISNAAAIGVCITVQDITIRKKVEIEHHHLISDLMQHINTLIEFAREMNTRVGEPLSVIKTTAEHAKADTDEGERTAALNSIYKLADGVHHLIDEMDKTLNPKKS